MQATLVLQPPRRAWLLPQPLLPALIPLPLPRCSLRAALNSTQGLDANPFHLQQLGLTPASASSGRAAGARGKRGSSVLRRDSEGGVMSEK